MIACVLLIGSPVKGMHDGQDKGADTSHRICGSSNTSIEAWGAIVALSAPPFHVTDAVEWGVAIVRPRPGYPPLATQNDVQSTVRIRTRVSEAGRVESREVIEKGHPTLVDAAQKAADQWRFTPTVVDGRPAEAIAEICFRFYRDE